MQVFSPNREYVAVLGNRLEVWGNYVVPLALWAARQKTLLYHREGYVAHALPGAATGTFVLWTADSRWAVFYEFKRQKAYQIVFVNTAEANVWRVEASDAILANLRAICATDATVRSYLTQQHEQLKEDATLDPVSAELSY